MSSLFPNPLVRDRVLLGLASAVLFVTNLGGAPLFDEDEPKNAACGAAMLRAGEWVVPTFNGELRVHKPILLYWVMRPGY
ncbi:MAG: glycosyltransferase, partial [Planctomycetota bacterium]